jgi:hypothetical protein
LPEQNIAKAKHCQSKTLPKQNIAKSKEKHCQIKSKTLPKQNIAKAKHCQSKTFLAKAKYLMPKQKQNLAGYKYFYLRTLTKFVSVWTNSLKTLCLGLMDFKSKFDELGEAIDVATDSNFGT